MAFRTFKVTIPSDTNYHNLFSLVAGTAVYGADNGGTDETGITGAIPTDGILPDRGNFLEIQADPGNGGGTVIVSDRNNANTDGKPLAAGAVFSVESSLNSICYKDYFLKGDGLTVEVRFEGI